MQRKNFSDLITFTRATTGTWLNPASGLIETAAINAPRIEAKGLLFEQQRTNLALRSAEFATSAWVKNGISVASSAILAPDGTPASKLTESATNAVHNLTQTGKVLSGTTSYCRSVYARGDGSGRKLRLATDFASAWSGTYAYVDFDLEAGTMSATAADSGTYGMEPAPAGWYRCWLQAQTVAVPGTVNITAHFVLGASTTYLGDGTSGIYMWGWQFEVGDSPSSYIPTAAAAVTRAADLAYVSSGPWLKPGQGTILVDAQLDSVDANYVTANLGTSGSGGRVSLTYRVSSGKAGAWIVDDAGATVFAPVAGPVVLAGAPFKQAVAYAPSGAQLGVAGALSATGAGSPLPSVNRLTLGARGVSTDHMQGHVRRIQYFPRRLSAAELQALTA